MKHLGFQTHIQRLLNCLLVEKVKTEGATAYVPSDLALSKLEELYDKAAIYSEPIKRINEGSDWVFLQEGQEVARFNKQDEDLVSAFMEGKEIVYD